MNRSARFSQPAPNYTSSVVLAFHGIGLPLILKRSAESSQRHQTKNRADINMSTVERYSFCNTFQIVSNQVYEFISSGKPPGFIFLISDVFLYS